MTTPTSYDCPNCSAPVRVPLGEVEAFCEYCASQLRFIPDADELEVVRTREEMKLRERVAVQQEILRRRVQQEELDRWRKAATKVAIATLPAIGGAASRAVVKAALSGRGAGRPGCGCGGTTILTMALLTCLYLLA